MESQGLVIKQEPYQVCREGGRVAQRLPRAAAAHTLHPRACNLPSPVADACAAVAAGGRDCGAAGAGAVVCAHAAAGQARARGESMLAAVHALWLQHWLADLGASLNLRCVC